MCMQLNFQLFEYPFVNYEPDNESVRRWIHNSRRRKVLGLALWCSDDKMHGNYTGGDHLALSPGCVRTRLIFTVIQTLFVQVKEEKIYFCVNN